MTENTAAANAIIPALSSEIRAVIFDYGNTLVPFGRVEVDAFDERLAAFLRHRFGSFNESLYHELRERDRLAPYLGDPPEYRESNLHRMVLDLYTTLYGHAPTPEEVAEIIETRRAIFVDIVKMSPETRRILRALRGQYRLGLLSNYPDGEAIRLSLAKNQADTLLDAILVSGDLGRVKPHPDVFRAITRALNVSPEQCLFIGDNWLADVQGARKAGMITMRFVRWVPPERFEPAPGDLPPHGEIDDLSASLALLSRRLPVAGDVANHG
mgnify:FL=1